MDKYSMIHLLVKTLLWFCVGIRGRLFASGDELSTLRYELERLKSENEILRKRLKSNSPKRHTWQEKLHVLRHMEVFNVPRRHVKNVFGIARSTYYRWLRQAEQGTFAGDPPANKTDDEVAGIVWRIFTDNPHFGRERIAMIIQKLNLFLSPSTVRNILSRARPKHKTPSEQSQSSTYEERSAQQSYPGIISRYPNHVWSVDRTIVKRWLIWPTYVLMAIDHYSRKIVWVSPLEGPNSAWMIDCLHNEHSTLMVHPDT